MTLSIILPCFNPASGWEQNICTVYTAFCQRINVTAELIVVLDGTNESVKETQITYLHRQIKNLKVVRYAVNKGKGYAIRQGVEIAEGDIILYTDIDFPYTIDSMCAVYRGLEDNSFDVGVGVKDENYYTQLPFMRRIISKFLRFLIRIFLSMPITDTQCGLKGFRKPVKTLFLRTSIDRYLFDLEFVRNCFLGKQFRVTAVPVVLNDNVHFRSMNYRILIPEMFNFARLLLKRTNAADK